MKIMQLGLLIIASVLFAMPANASYQEGKVTQMLVRQSDGLHYFFMDGFRDEKPNCSVGHDYWMIKDENSRAGQSQFAMLLMAYAAGKTIRVVGTNECSRWHDGEDTNYIYLK